MAESIVEALYAKLINDQSAGTFYAALSGRIYMLEAPQNATLPLCVITPIASTVDPYFDNKHSREALVQISLWGHHNDGLSALLDINTKLYALLQGSTFTPSGYDRALASCQDDGIESSEEDGIQVISEWLIEATQTS